MTVTVFDWRQLKIGDNVFVRFAKSTCVTLCIIVDIDNQFYSLSRDIKYGDCPNWYVVNRDFWFEGVRS